MFNIKKVLKVSGMLTLCILLAFVFAMFATACGIEVKYRQGVEAIQKNALARAASAQIKTIHNSDKIYFGDKTLLAKTIPLSPPSDAVKVHRLAFDGQEPYIEYEDSKGNRILQHYTWRGEPNETRYMLSNKKAERKSCELPEVKPF